MSQYPIESNEQLFQAVNYLLSGPGGLGQNFQGFSAYTPAYLTGNYRIPFTVASINKVANSGTAGEFTIVILPNTSGVDIGYSVSGLGIGVGAVVTAVDYYPNTGYQITLSVANTDKIDNETVIFTPPVSTIPYVNVGPGGGYSSPIPCSSAVQIDDRTFQYNFTAPQATPPFKNGNNLTGSGWTNGFYNDNQGVIGVIKCTTTYVVFRTSGFYPGIGDDLGGGFVAVDNMGIPLSTDCNARVTVTGGTDRVFVSAQLNNKITYTATVGGNLTYRVQVNRYYGIPNNDPINPDYIFILSGTVAEKSYTLSGLAGPGSTLPEIETIFSTIVDSPGKGYYWYILEVYFDAGGSDIIVETSEFNLRSLSAQVVKE